MKTNFNRPMMNILLVLTFSIFAMSLVSAAGTVGIKWYTESEIVSENSENCITYGSYNPSPEDVLVNIAVSGDLVGLVESTTENRLIEANTGSAHAEDIQFCFTIKEGIYEENCLFGNIACEKTCDEAVKEYSGGIVMTNTPAEGAEETGSGVTVAAAAPLRLTVECSPHPRDLVPIYLILIIVIVIILIITTYKKNSRSK